MRREIPRPGQGTGVHQPLARTSGVSVRHCFVGIQVNTDQIKSRLSEAADAYLMETNAQRVLVDVYAEIAIAGLAVGIFFQSQALAFDGGPIFQIVDISVKFRFGRRLAVRGVNDGIYVMAAVAADNVRHLILFASELDGSPVTLIILSVAGKDCGRIYADVATNSVNLAQHIGTTAVVAAESCAFLRSVAEWRMMHRQYYGPGIFFLLDSLKLCLQECDLIIRHIRPASGRS